MAFETIRLPGLSIGPALTAVASMISSWALATGLRRSANPDPRKSVRRAIIRLDGNLVLSGTPPHPTDRPAGCAFHLRCEHRMPRCDRDVPKLLPTPSGATTDAQMIDLRGAYCALSLWLMARQRL